MTDASSAAYGWSTLAFGASGAIALAVCLLVARYASPFLERTDREFLIPWLVIGSLVIMWVVALLVIAPHVPARMGEQ